MGDKVINLKAITPLQALSPIRRLGDRSSCIGLPPHTRRRMRQRQVSFPQIRHTISHGVATEGHYQDLFGNWICRLEARVAGKNVATVVMMTVRNRLKVMTVIA